MKTSKKQGFLLLVVLWILIYSVTAIASPQVLNLKEIDKVLKEAGKVPTKPNKQNISNRFQILHNLIENLHKQNVAIPFMTTLQRNIISSIEGNDLTRVTSLIDEAFFKLEQVVLEKLKHSPQDVSTKTKQSPKQSEAFLDNEKKKVKRTSTKPNKQNIANRFKALQNLSKSLLKQNNGIIDSLERNDLVEAARLVDEAFSNLEQVVLEKRKQSPRSVTTETRQDKIKYRNITVDASNVIGQIKSLLGVNAGPYVPVPGRDLAEEYSDLGINYVRTHDFNGPTDIDMIFLDFSKDAELAENYDFEETDKVIKAIIDIGAKVIYRLGYSWGDRGSTIDPPEDFGKWANICKHIIMHYNNGWANGFHYNIKYWEIWNEPEVHTMWNGTPTQFYRLFEVVAKELKAYNPALMIGGPAVTSKLQPEYHEYFLDYVKSNKVPLDFFSWHSYGPQPRSVARDAFRWRKALDERGFLNTESILDEWNIPMGTVPSSSRKWRKIKKMIGEEAAKELKYTLDVFENYDFTPTVIAENGEQKRPYKHIINAPFVASTLIYLQDTDVEIATFYRGDYHSFGLFDFKTGYTKPAYAFKAMKMVLDATPERLFTEGSDDSGYAVLAGISQNKDTISVLISDFFSEYSGYKISINNLPWQYGNLILERFVLDKTKNLEMVETTQIQTKPTLYIERDCYSPSIQLVLIKKGPLNK